MRYWLKKQKNQPHIINLARQSNVVFVDIPSAFRDIVCQPGRLMVVDFKEDDHYKIGYIIGYCCDLLYDSVPFTYRTEEFRMGYDDGYHDRRA